MSVVLEKSALLALDEDHLLVDRFNAGDEAAFERLYTKYYDKTYSIARGVLLDSEDASDTVQEIFTLVYRHLGRFDHRSKFSTWLYRIAVNRSIQESRRARYRYKHVPLTEAIPETPTEAGPHRDPKIQTALAKMRPADRLLITLFYWEELSLQDIAQTLGCNANAAKTRLYRARERFREHYESEDA